MVIHTMTPQQVVAELWSGPIRAAWKGLDEKERRRVRKIETDARLHPHRITASRVEALAAKYAPGRYVLTQYFLDVAGS